MSCTPCIAPSQATLAFFPGTRGPGGPPGAPSTVPGPQGEPGIAGASIAITGAFVAGTVYYDTDYRRDVVQWNGRWWITNNRAKSGLNTWDAPTVDDWADFGATLISYATALNLQQATNIAVGLNIQTPGYIKSNNFVVEDGTGWLGSAAGALIAYDAIINGLVSTNTPKFNLESETRTMPAQAQAQFDIPAIADGDIPENPTINNVTDDSLIFFGWLQGTNAFVENRFGNENQKFQINLNGTGENVSGGSELFYIQIYYRTRTNGGAWGAWTVIGQDTYMQKIAGIGQSFDLTRYITLAGLTGDDDVQFSAGFSKGTGGTVAVNGAQITVTASN
jgi:hypothetical protein